MQRYIPYIHGFFTKQPKPIHVAEVCMCEKHVTYRTGIDVLQLLSEGTRDIDEMQGVVFNDSEGNWKGSF